MSQDRRRKLCGEGNSGRGERDLEGSEWTERSRRGHSWPGFCPTAGYSYLVICSFSFFTGGCL